jgi:hypothetical protein
MFTWGFFEIMQVAIGPARAGSSTWVAYVSHAPLSLLSATFVREDEASLL